MSGWPGEGELRIGLGCMRLDAAEPILAAVAAGITVFDTAHSYGPTAGDSGRNERLLAAALAATGATGTAHIVTKGGMARIDNRWAPDGRARTLLADCEGALQALGGLPIDLFLVHAPDPSTPWRTTVRALRRLHDEGLVRRVGVANVNRRQLAEALDLAPLAAVQVSLSLFDDAAVRGGVLELCERHALPLIAHSPLGGPRRRSALARSQPVREVAAALGATPAQVALAWLLGLSPLVVPIPGGRRPESVEQAAQAAALRLDGRQRELLTSAFGLSTSAPAPRADRAGEVILVMGIPGAGKSRLAEEYRRSGYLGLNRDERGGTLAELAGEVAAQLKAGERRIVLDNTYLTRAGRSRVLEAAAAQGAGVRCIWLDTPLAQAQVNLVERLLDRFGALPDPETLRRVARAGPGLHTPTSQMRTLRELEPPAEDEGFTAVERRSFARVPDPDRGASAVFVAASAVALGGVDPGLPHLLFDWRPGPPDDAPVSAAAELRRRVRGPVEVAVCTHPGGPPSCWCRPPLPGLLLDFARRHRVDPARSTVVGTSAAHRALAAALGARYLGV